jgi:hypothetical protein
MPFHGDRGGKDKSYFRPPSISSLIVSSPSRPCAGHYVPGSLVLGDRVSELNLATTRPRRVMLTALPALTQSRSCPSLLFASKAPIRISLIGRERDNTRGDLTNSC